MATNRSNRTDEKHSSIDSTPVTNYSVRSTDENTNNQTL